MGPNYFVYFEIISKNILFKFILMIWTIGIFYHLYNGCRKLYWSFGVGMDLTTVYRSGYIVLFLTLVSTITVWVLV